jgi:hypothetical protein
MWYFNIHQNTGREKKTSAMKNLVLKLVVNIVESGIKHHNPNPKKTKT